MAEKWSQIKHILEREDREFQEAMREQVGTTFSHIYSSNKRESFKTFTGAAIITQCTARKKPEFYTMPAPPASSISIKTNSLLYPLSTLGSGPKSWCHVEAALSLYEREEGPMPSKVSYTKIPINRGSRWYLPLLAGAYNNGTTTVYCLFSFSPLFQAFFFLSCSQNPK